MFDQLNFIQGFILGSLIGFLLGVSAMVFFGRKTEYKYSFLVEQKVAVEQDLANVITRHATELAVAQANVDEVVGLLKEWDKLEVKEAEVVVE